MSHSLEMLSPKIFDKSVVEWFIKFGSDLASHCHCIASYGSHVGQLPVAVAVTVNTDWYLQSN